MGTNKPYRIPGPDKTLYEGECNSEGKYEGKGTIKYGDNCTFTGTFKKGYPVNGKITY
jgi:hypothetical protein